MFSPEDKKVLDLCHHVESVSVCLCLRRHRDFPVASSHFGVLYRAGSFRWSCRSSRRPLQWPRTLCFTSKYYWILENLCLNIYRQRHLKILIIFTVPCDMCGACGTTLLARDWLCGIAGPTVRASMCMPQRSPCSHWKGARSTGGDWLVQEAGASAHP